MIYLDYVYLVCQKKKEGGASLQGKKNSSTVRTS